MRLSLVILTYNEIVGLRKIFDMIPKDSVEEIFAVDGGSVDGSIEFMESKGNCGSRSNGERPGRGVFV